MGVITSISVQAKDKSRANIFVDGEFCMGVPAIVVAENRLKTGMEISSEKLAGLALDADKEQALSKATSLVAKVLKTEREMRTYLLDKKFLPDSVSNAIDKLKQFGYLDDYSYACAYINTHAKARGAIRITNELKIKGVSEQNIQKALDEAIASNSIDQSKSCFDLAVKYMKNKPLDQKSRQKLSAYLYSRGYSWETASPEIDKIFDRIEKDNF